MPLYLQENFTVNLAGQLRRGDLDVIVVALPFAEPGVVSRVVYEEPFCVVMPRQHPLAQQKRIDPRQVAAERACCCWAMATAFATRWCRPARNCRRRVGQRDRLEGSSLETVRYMIASGAGISVVPASAAASWPREDSLLSVRQFSDPAPVRKVVIAWRATFPRPQAIDVLRAAIVDSPPPGVLIA
jgi:LysR family hydrogen peroxide-inducible transcriptional activator